MTALLQAQGIEAGYGAFKALFGISLRVEEGEAVGIIGSNGAGKTTLLRVLAGWLPLEAGQVQLGGRSLADIPPEQVVTHGLALVPEGRRLIPRMSVEDNLRLGAAVALPRAELARRLDEVFALFPKLLERRRQLAGTMSGGEQQMCAVGRALMSRPRILLLDEPSAGLAPAIVDQMFEFVRELRRRGMTIVLVEQHIPQLLRSVDRLYAMEGGRICHEATAAAVAADRSAIERMIGLHGRSASV